MPILNDEQMRTARSLVGAGLSDFEVAQRVCPDGEDPELLLESVSTLREGMPA
ncbi:hypothetical protein [Roseivivax sp. CAU 1761]